MRVLVELKDEDTQKTIHKAIALLGGISVVSFSDADLYVGEKEHPLIPSVLVSDTVPTNPDGYIDVIRPKQSFAYYVMKFKLLSCYLLASCGVENYLDEEIFKSQRYGVPLTLTLVHVEEDREIILEALSRIYSTMRKLVRSSDKICLLDDQNIISIMPFTPLKGGVAYSRRLLRHIIRIKTPQKANRFPNVFMSVCQISQDIYGSDEAIAKLEFGIQDGIRRSKRISIVD